MSDIHEKSEEACNDVAESNGKLCGNNEMKDQNLEGEVDTDQPTKVHDGCDDITEEQENKLLADDCEDLDVIDCYTEDFESDMEADFCRKEAKKADIKLSCSATVKRDSVENVAIKSDSSENKNIITDAVQEDEAQEKNSGESSSHTRVTLTEGVAEADLIVPDQKPLDLDVPKPIVTAVVVEEDNDDDVIQINDENIELLLMDNESTSKHENVSQPDIVRVKDQNEQERILQKPLIKQIVPEINVSDEENDGSDIFGSQESLNLQIDHFVAKASELRTANKKDKLSGKEIKVDYEAKSNDNREGSYLDNYHTEDADFQQLKLEFYENDGTVDLESKEKPNEAAAIDKQPENIKKGHETSDAATKNICIKEEPITPVKERLERLNIPDNAIPTIDLTSSDDENIGKAMSRKFVYGQLKPSKRKPRKKKKNIEISIFSSPDTTLKLLKSECSIDSLKRNDSDSISVTSFDDVMSGSDRIISLRKRMVTVLPETPPKVVCHRKTKRAETDPLKGPVKRKKRDNPCMRGYKRRKPHRSISKCSTRSVSTAGSSLMEDEIGIVDDVSLSLANTYCTDGDTTEHINTDADDPQRNVQISEIDQQEVKDELLDSTQLKEAIAKELQSEFLTADGSMQTNNVQNSSDISLPEARTDIALEDMLEDFFNREEEQKKNTFCSITMEEKMIMDSLFDDCDKEFQPNSTCLNERNLQPTSTECNQITISYTISDSTDPISFVPINQDDDRNLDANQSDKLKGPQFKIIQNYDRYKKLLQPRPTKPVKVIEPLPRGNRRKRADSDEDYRPNSSYLKKRLFSRPRKRVAAKVEGSNHFLPTGEYITPDEANVTYKNMPSLEEDLALTSSDSGSIGNGTVEVDKQTQPEQKGIQLQNVTENTMVEKKTPVPVKAKKRGRPPMKGSKICEFFCSATGQQKGSCNAPCCVCDTASQPSQFVSGKPGDKKAQKKRGKKLDVNSFDNATELFAGNPSPSLNTESSDDLFSTPSMFLPEHVEREFEENDCLLDETKGDYKIDNLQVIISPLTDEKIRKINTPKKKPKGLAKACQTEIGGLAWSIEFDQINFRSEHFEKLRALLNSGAARNALRRANDEGKILSPKKLQKDSLGNLERVDMGRDVLQSALNSPASAPSTISLPDQAVEPTSNARRSSVESLLFQKRINEVEAPSRNSNDENAQKQLVKSIRSTFRIPKIVKQPSTSPQPVTSSTSGVMEAYFGKADDEQTCAMQLSCSPREPPTSRAPETAPLANRPVEREYIDDETASYPSSNSSAQSYAREDPRRNALLPKRFEVQASTKGGRESSTSRASPLNFANALNFKYVPIAQAEEKKNAGATAVTAPNCVPTMSNPLENRVTLPDRAEMINVKRTIRNDITQPPAVIQQSPQTIQQPPQVIQQPSQVIQQPPQMSEHLQQLQFPMAGPFPTSMSMDYKFNQQTLPGFQTFANFGSNSSFNKGYQSNNDFEIKPSISNIYGGWGNFGRPDIMNPGGQPEGFKDFVAMLYEQYKQQVAPAPAPTMPINMAGPSHLSPFGQWFPSSTMPSMLPPAGAVKPHQPTMLPVANTSKPMHSSETVEMICYLFGCYDFFIGKCIKLHCRLSHVLPHEEEVLQKLSLQNCDFIMATYRFVNSRDDFFAKYFPVYAGVMGRNKMRHQLVGTIQDCEKPKRPLQYYRYIVDALKISGTSPTQAVQILIDKHKKTSFYQINILIELILDTGEGVPSFLRWLEDFLHVKGYSYEMSAINRLLDVVMEYPSLELIKLISKVVLKVTVGNECLINTTSLLEFAKKAREYPEMELDVEDIVKKYGGVVMRV